MDLDNDLVLHIKNSCIFGLCPVLFTGTFHEALNNTDATIIKLEFFFFFFFNKVTYKEWKKEPSSILSVNMRMKQLLLWEFLSQQQSWET